MKIVYPNGISPNDMFASETLQKMYILECLKYNYIVSSELKPLHIRDKCRIYDAPQNKLDKKRSTIKIFK